MTREETATAFAAVVDRLTPIVDQEVQWPAVRLRHRTFVGDHPLPAVLITSVRAVVFKGPCVVVVRTNDGGSHINPGGRREAGESLEQTARREVLEECGWHLGPLKPIGFHHFQHLDEKPETFPYPWADFVHLIHVAEAVRYDRAARDMSQIEVGASLVPISRALRDLPDDELPLLRAAIAARGR